MKKLCLPIFFIVACAPGLPGGVTPKGSKFLGATSAEAKKPVSMLDLMQLKAQNDALCLRVQKQRVECPAAGKSLRTEDDQAILGCVSGVAADAKVESNFELDISIPSGTKAILTAQNGLWQTNAVASGSKQKLTWGPRTKNPCDVLPARATSLVTSPRVIELTNLMLRVLPDSCSDNRSIGKGEVNTFSLAVNGTPLFGRDDLSDSNGGIQVSLSKMLQLAQDPKCNVPKDELQKLMAEAKSKVSGASAGSPPADLEAQVARETNRNDQMMKQLSGIGDIGCWGYSKIRKLQVKIDGSALPNKNLGLRGGAGQNSGNSKEYTFTFGQNMVHAISDESQNAIFRSGGGFVIDTFADREIQELRNLKIVKGGAAYQNDPYRDNGFFGIGGWSGFTVYELDRRSLSKLTIIANDQVVYERSGISVTFEDGRRDWSDNIQNNSAFSKLMARKDCPAE